MRETVTFASVISGLLLLVNINIKAQNITLTAPAAPFKNSTHSVKLVKPQPQINGREIIFGSKKLIIAPSGAMTLLSEGRKLCEMYFYVNTEWSSWMTNIDRGEVPAKWKHGNVGITKSGYNKAKKQFFVKGNFPLNKAESGHPAEGTFIETIKLLDSGKVKVEIQYIIPEKNRGFFKRTCLFLKCSEMENFSIAGGKYTFKEKVQLFFKPAKINFAKDSARKSFNVDIVSSAMISAIKSKGKEDFRIYPQRTNKISFILDIGKIAVDSREPQTATYGGVNFKKTDDLDLPNYSDCRNLIKNPSFEQGVMYCMTKNHYHGNFGVKGLEADDSEALFGKHRLKISLYKDGYNTLFSPVPVTPGKYVFSFYAKGDGSEGQRIAAHVQNASYARLSSGNRTISKTWQRIVLPFEIKKTTVASCSIKLTGNYKSAIYIDGLQLEKGSKASEFVSPQVEGLLITSKEDNFFSPEEKIKASLQIFSTKPEVSGKAKVTVKDFFGIKRFEKEYPFKTDKDGVVLIKLPFDDKFPRGIYIVKADYALDNGQKLHDFFRFSIMSYLENKHKLKAMFANSYHGPMKRDSYPGLETYLKRCRDIGTGGEMHAGFVSRSFDKLLNKYGIKIINADMTGFLMNGYKKVTDADGRKFFGIYSDTGWKKDAKLFIQDFRLEKDGKLTDEYLKNFKKAVMEMVRKYPWIPRWAFAGECWAKWSEWLTDDVESFAKLQIAFYKAVKMVNPKLEVYNGAPCNIYPEGGIKRLRKILEAINGRIKYDAFAIHAYLPDGPYSLEANMEALFKMLGEFGYTNTPVFYPEGMHYGPYNIPQWGIVSASWSPPKTWYYGTLSYDMGWSEKLSAAWFARSWLVCMKFMDRVIAANSAVTNMISNFHLDINLTPRAYQKIPNTLGRLLGNSRFVEDISFAPDTKCLVFEDEKQRPVAAVWSKIKKVDLGIKDCPWAITKFKNTGIEIFDLMETRREANTDGDTRFPVSTFPLFIRGKSGTTKSFCAALRNAKMLGGNLIPLGMIAKVADPETVNLVLSNQISRVVKGSLSASGLKNNINIPSREQVSFKIKIKKTLSANEIIKVKIPIAVTEKGSPETLKKDVSFEGFLCRRIKSSVKIDGNEDDWKNIPAISLKNRTTDDTTGEKIGYKGDFDGYFKIAWNKNYLYLMVKIKDDVFAHKSYKDTTQRWNNDSLQIYIDTKCDARDRKHHGYDANDYDYAVFPDKNGKTVTFRYRSPDQQLTLGTEAPPDRVVEPHIPSAFRKTPDGYIYEVAFPAKYLLPVKLQKNYALGFSLFVNDRDKGKNRKQALTLTPPGTGSFRKPHLYPVMLLVE